ncbi:MAG: dihydropyrimidinase [Phycisphaerales bacterium]|nr:dihydropyrimidinase [Phycisphaerales bacterium]
MPLLIKNGRIITADADYHGDIYCAGEKITRIEDSIDPGSLPSDTEVINASGRYVFPGFVDPHVHVHLPFMGTFAKDDHESASRAAIVGGTTTYIEMICPAPDQEPMDAFNEWQGKAKDQSHCDYSFHLGVVRFDDLAREQIRRIVRDHGIASFKVFLAYKGALDISDENLFDLLSMGKELGVITTAHCENATAIAAMQQKLLSEGKTGPEWHEPSRPVRVEAEGVHHLATFAELTGAHVYAVHTSCAAAIEEARAAQARGVKLWVESVIPHFALDHTHAEQVNFEGAKYVMSPPLRDRANHDVLWAALASGVTSTVGTDHAPFDFNGQKDMGKDDFTLIPNGIPSIQERIDLLHTLGVKTGRIDLNTFVRVASTNAAQIFGLKGKGTISVGADADIVVYDPEHKHTLSAKTHQSQVDYNGFEGWEVTGRAETVTVRGKVMARDGGFVGDEPGRGRLIQREPTHF